MSEHALKKWQSAISIVVCNSEVSCPKVMATKSHDLLKKKVKNLIQVCQIVTLKIISFEKGDKALAQFGEFLENEATTEKKKFWISKVQINVLMTCILRTSKFTKIILHSPLS